MLDRSCYLFLRNTMAVTISVAILGTIDDISVPMLFMLVKFAFLCVPIARSIDSAYGLFAVTTNPNWAEDPNVPRGRH